MGCSRGAESHSDRKQRQSQPSTHRASLRRGPLRAFRHAAVKVQEFALRAASYRASRDTNGRCIRRQGRHRRSGSASVQRRQRSHRQQASQIQQPGDISMISHLERSRGATFPSRTAGKRADFLFRMATSQKIIPSGRGVMVSRRCSRGPRPDLGALRRSSTTADATHAGPCVRVLVHQPRDSDDDTPNRPSRL